jgi:hypothetical protein
MKSQTQIIQFILFFVISISIFSLISSYIFSFSQSSQDRLLSSFRELVASYASGFLVNIYTGCKYCNYTSLKYGIPYQSFDNFHEINATNNIIYVRSMPLQKQVFTSVHNLNITVKFTGFYSTGATFSFYGLNKTSIVSISFNKTENKFKIGE